MKINLYKKLFKLQKETKREIEKYLSNKLNLTNYDNNAEVLSIDLQEEYQSDCDGDNNLINCKVKIKILSEECKKLFYSFMKKDSYHIRNCKVANGCIRGLEYTFDYEYYEIK